MLFLSHQTWANLINMPNSSVALVTLSYSSQHFSYSRPEDISQVWLGSLIHFSLLVCLEFRLTEENSAGKHCMLVVVQADLNHYSLWRASVCQALFLLALISVWLPLSVMFLFIWGTWNWSCPFKEGIWENRQSFQNKALMMKWIFKNTLWSLCVCLCDFN